MITLKTLPQATAQEVYDQVKTHLLSQMRRSEANGNCSYRGEGGLKCAAGILISDEEMENLGIWNNETWDRLVKRKLVPQAHQNLIIDLQIVHDTVCVIDWKKHLLTLAIKYDVRG